MANYYFGKIGKMEYNSEIRECEIVGGISRKSESIVIMNTQIGNSIQKIKENTYKEVNQNGFEAEYKYINDGKDLEINWKWVKPKSDLSDSSKNKTNDNTDTSEKNKYEDEIENFVKIACKEVGYQEGKNNDNKYGIWYKNNNKYWCAQFVSWCANQAGIMEKLVPRYESCYEGSQWFIKKGKYATRESKYEPKVGDIVFFNSDGIHHTGIVVAYDSKIKKVYTVEGNTDNKVKQKIYTQTTTYINGYGKTGGSKFSIGLESKNLVEGKDKIK